jgi:hypothetical protein
MHGRHRPDTSAQQTAHIAGALRRPRRHEEYAMESTTATACYQLRFRSLFDEGRALAFPCDAQGHVDLDALSPRALQNYLYARTVIGREFFMPSVLAPLAH